VSAQIRGHNGSSPETGPKPTASAAPRGFSAQLRGASLWDLVQMECLARSHRVVRIVGEGGVGYVYFDRGQIFHATTAHRTGEEAALEILGWNNGSFQTCDRAWPEQATIAVSHEALILQVAKLRDEGRASNLVAFPTPPGPADEEVFEELELSELAPEGVEAEGEGNMRGSNMDEAVPTPKPAAASGRTEVGAASGRTEVGTEFSVMMRLGPNGAVVSNRGGNEDLAEAVAYVERLLQLTGELLGFGPFTAMEGAFTAEGRCIIFADGSGETVALRARPDANLQALRERLGL
jgi:hypothetical protein